MNRKPKDISRKPKGWVDTCGYLMQTVNAYSSATQTALISSQPIESSPKQEKAANIAATVLNCALKAIEIAKGEKRRRFKATGRYTNRKRK